MGFVVRPLRFHFVAQDPIYFPPNKPGNILRGAFGLLFREQACRCPDAHTPDCAYARIFEPTPVAAGGPSGFADLPRPFVLRAAHLDGRRVLPGESFDFGVNLFTREDWPVPHFEAAFARLAETGIGPGRGRAVLQRTERSMLELSLAEPALPVSRVAVEFVTPTELKSAEGLMREPLFEPLIARLRDRISNLGAQYGLGPLEVDFRRMAAEARGVSVESADLRYVDAERTSSRTGQTHPLSGFVGGVTYSGDVTQFLPYLEIGQYTGVGRQTVWGKGELKLLVA